MIALLLMSAATDPALLTGRALYHDGQGTPRPAMFLGGSTVAAPGQVLPCGGCHGADGTPPAENRAAPSLERLARTARDPALFRAALETGRGADGHLLQLMPRYQLTVVQREGLARYIASIASGQAIEPGVEDGAIVVSLSGLSAMQARTVRSRLSGREFYGRTVRFGEGGFITVANTRHDLTTVDFAQLDAIAPAFARTGRVLTRAGFFEAMDAIQREAR